MSERHRSGIRKYIEVMNTFCFMPFFFSALPHPLSKRSFFGSVHDTKKVWVLYLLLHPTLRASRIAPSVKNRTTQKPTHVCTSPSSHSYKVQQ